MTCRKGRLYLIYKNRILCFTLLLLQTLNVIYRFFQKCPWRMSVYLINLFYSSGSLIWLTFAVQFWSKRISSNANCNFQSQFSISFNFNRWMIKLEVLKAESRKQKAENRKELQWKLLNVITMVQTINY